jgi:hypothetical protein
MARAVDRRSLAAPNPTTEGRSDDKADTEDTSDPLDLESEEVGRPLNGGEAGTKLVNPGNAA